MTRDDGQVARRREIEAALPSFEGLVKRTAQEIVATGVELEFDDVAQLIRVKVWHAVRRFNPADSQHMQPRDRRGRTPLERWVFGAVLNLRKDIEKRPRRYNASIDEIRDRGSSSEPSDRTTADWFDYRFLSVEHDEVYWDVEEGGEPLLPSTLTILERRVVLLLFNGQTLQEIDRELGLSRGQREEVMRSVRTKLADWRPSAEPVRAPMRPLPDAEPLPARARVPQAA